MSDRLAIRPLALSCLFVVMACGSKAREPQVHRVEIRSMQFMPASLAVSVGDIVVWTNEDIVPHTATSAGVFDSSSLNAKQEWRFTAAKAGEYPYICTFHPTMKATLVVR